MRRLLIGTALLLAACGSKATFNETNGAGNEAAALNETDQNAAMPSEANASQNAPANEVASSNALGMLPPADAALRFLGKWATDKKNCASKPWTFTEKALSAADGPNCNVPGGFRQGVNKPSAFGRRNVPFRQRRRLPRPGDRRGTTSAPAGRKRRG